MRYFLRALGSSLLMTTMLLPVFGQAQEAALITSANQAPAQITDLDELLVSVRAQQQEQRASNRQREARFLDDKKNQQRRLAKAKSEAELRKRENQPLIAVTQSNQQRITQLQAELEAVLSDMGDLHSIFGEFAGDFSAVLQDSMISAQLPARAAQLDELAATTHPGIQEIETLWLLLQEDMTEAGKVVQFDTTVVSVEGAATPTKVLRVGSFSAFSNANFLRYVPETRELMVLSRQPATRYRNAASVFDVQSSKLALLTIDPTRGSLLGMLTYSPTLFERIEQGGTIALIIIALGAIGLVIALWRVLYLSTASVRIKRQLANLGTPQTSNALGRVLHAVKGVDSQEEELLQLKLDEAVLAEMPALERGNGVIKLLAATSPLLGLLGTVTGMILTFQSISLYGTGDPKLMAGGISQALVTTVLGLVVAIPLLFSHSIVAYMSRSLIQRLDEQCAGVLARYAEAQERTYE